MTAITFETAPRVTMALQTFGGSLADVYGLVAASSHVAMIKRFCEIALMTVLFTVVIAGKVAAGSAIRDPTPQLLTPLHR